MVVKTWLARLKHYLPNFKSNKNSKISEPNTCAQQEADVVDELGVNLYDEEINNTNKQNRKIVNIMAEELQMQTQGAAGDNSFLNDKYLDEIKNIANPEDQLAQSIEGLEDYGEFELLEDLVEGLDNMNPENKAAKSIFLQESEFKSQREKMAKEIISWLNVLKSDAETVSEAVETCKTEGEKAQKNLQANIANVRQATKKLETSYRSLAQFFANTGQDKLSCLTLMNVNKDDVEEIKAADGEIFTAVQKELKNSFDRLSLRENYSLLVAPGYLGDKQTVNMWGQMAYRNKVMMVTDFKDEANLKNLVKGLDNAKHNDTDAYLANVVMACNYILGRKKSDAEYSQDEDLYLPPSSAIAGRMVNTEETPMSQGIAGKKYGTIDNARGTRIDLLKSELTSLIDKGVVPMTFEENRVMAFSNRSLYNGATIGLQEYPVVRVFDWIGKVFSNFFNDEAFKNWNSKLSQELREQIIDFLEDYKGPGKLIEGYSNPKIIRDEKTKDIHIEIELKPFFAAKNFYIKLTGHNGDNGITEWSNEIK